MRNNIRDKTQKEKWLQPFLSYDIFRNYMDVYFMKNPIKYKN